LSITGEEDLLPDATGAEMYRSFRQDPKAFERQLAAMG